MSRCLVLFLAGGKWFKIKKIGVSEVILCVVFTRKIKAPHFFKRGRRDGG